MELISFACPVCEHKLRIGADKAGRRARCPRCKSPLVIPSANQPAGGVPAAAGAAGALDDEEDSPYQMLGEPPPPVPDLDSDSQDEETDEVKPLGDERAKRTREELAALRKAPMYTDQWRIVRVGMMFVMVGTIASVAAFNLHKIILVMGVFQGSEYAYLATNVLVDPDEVAVAGQWPTLYQARFCVGLLAGSWFLWLAVPLFLFVFLLSLVQCVFCGLGYVTWIGAPPEKGLRGMAIAALALAAANALCIIVFRILPLTGLMTWTNFSIFAPEIALLHVNMDRYEPIHVTLSYLPFLESVLAVFVRALMYADTLILCVFLYYASILLKEEKLEPIAKALVKLTLGVLFADIGFILMANVGTTEVLVYVLRLIYALYAGLCQGLLIWLIIFLVMARRRIKWQLRYA